MSFDQSFNPVSPQDGALSVGQRMQRIEQSVSDLDEKIDEKLGKLEEKLDSALSAIAQGEVTKARVSSLENFVYGLALIVGGAVIALLMNLFEGAVESDNPRAVEHTQGVDHGRR